MTTKLSTISLFAQTLFTHLWLSISSAEFYAKVLRSYKGYGIKYALTLACISSFMCTLLFLNHLDEIRTYLDKGTITATTEDLNHIIRQIPDIDYDGNKISLSEETPFYINSKNNYKAMSIDPNHELTQSMRIKIPMIIGSEKILMNFLNTKGELINTIPINYTKIFGEHPQTLTQETIKSYLSSMLAKSPSIFIYLIFPLLTFLIFIYSLMEKSFTIFMIYIITKITNIRISFKSSVRIVLFSSGIFIALQCVVALALPFFVSILNITQTWANLLMIAGILKASGQKIFFSR